MFIVRALLEFARALRIRIILCYNKRRAKIDGLTLILPSEVMSDYMAFSILGGRYDLVDRLLIRKYVKSGDSVIELGTGCGLTAMVAYQQVGPSGHVLTIEPDSRLLDLAVRNFALNGMRIETRQGAAVADKSLKQVTLYKSRDFWGSNITGYGKQVVARPTVEGVYLPDLIDTSAVNCRVLLCDIEGYEARLLANVEIIDLFDLILVEVHNYSWPPKADGEELAAMFHTVLSSGFRIVETTDKIFVFARERKGTQTP